MSSAPTSHDGSSVDGPIIQIGDILRALQKANLFDPDLMKPETFKELCKIYDEMPDDEKKKYSQEFKASMDEMGKKFPFMKDTVNIKTVEDVRKISEKYAALSDAEKEELFTNVEFESEDKFRVPFEVNSKHPDFGDFPELAMPRSGVIGSKVTKPSLPPEALKEGAMYGTVPMWSKKYRKIMMTQNLAMFQYKKKIPSFEKPQWYRYQQTYLGVIACVAMFGYTSYLMISHTNQWAWYGPKSK